MEILFEPQQKRVLELQTVMGELSKNYMEVAREVEKNHIQTQDALGLRGSLKTQILNEVQNDFYRF